MNSTLPPLLFATQEYEYLADLMAADGSSAGMTLERANLERKQFPDGERYLRIVTPVESREIIVVGGTISDRDTLELYDLSSAICKYGATRLTLVMPYYGYSTMERAVKPGEVVTAKTRARLFSSLPPAMNGNRLLLLDVHSEGLPHYFEGWITSKHLYAKSAIIQALRHNYQAEEFVLGSTDAGRAKWVQSLANEMGVAASLVLKRRLSGQETELVAISANVKGLHVALYDDMIRTGGTLITAARAYLDAGARSVSAFATHGILPPGALQRLQQSGLFQKIVCTNSHPQAVLQQCEFLKVVSIADILVHGLSTWSERRVQ
jgi:ribose-phosphate pyrophosphokinase